MTLNEKVLKNFDFLQNDEFLISQFIFRLKKCSFFGYKKNYWNKNSFVHALNIDILKKWLNLKTIRLVVPEISWEPTLKTLLWEKRI